MPTIETNDGTNIYYEEMGNGRPLLMIHGWGFSGRFFHRNVESLAKHARVITIDLRGHGNSDKPSHGYRVPRLARDLYDVLAALDLQDVTVLGWSLGCPVIWSYFELFGTERLKQAVFVEQSPRQYYGLDWKYAHATCYDDASFAYTKAQVEMDTSNFDKNQIKTIMETEPAQDERERMLAEMAKAPASARNAIMSDHTRYDWRDLIPEINLQSLVMVARQDKVFSWRGPAWVGENIPSAQTVFFEHSSHALFLDEPEKFNDSVIQFMSNEGGI
ncbi:MULTISPECIES: alpha/beta fold hydrolase [Bacillus]|uniref:Peroxidase n=2 Tax=Bacillus TaxID=1386 RepID=A0A0M5JAR3_9BACI|nr:MULTISPECIES: alpha/beta hydrolase [Bacillus]ALC83457.1 peroxidase [Bacillus gobiensis]MBP1082411.1 pimeloyl-ACP methyl ester carboxylesterase [Bacillus capparidis]MED1097337.1 alpha/beta hydrolase [Bacillus capparidis]